jgi:bifunctional UDP-N-acetylglucosamine pyrophosphorylase/glucosamine-1-phosphate N-acetyltransferase
VPELRVLIAAAGTGSRAALPYPKTLHPVLGEPILVRLIRLLRHLDPHPTVIVSPGGEALVAQCLDEHRLQAELVRQEAPTGMGDAVLRFRDASSFGTAEHVLLVWGDIPLIQPETVERMCARHFSNGNDFTFVTRHVERAYTIVSRNADGAVASVVETRETGAEPEPGEREIGLFLFRARPVLDLLAGRLPGSISASTGEHGFLYIIGYLANAGHRVEALPIATELDLISLNRLQDLESLGVVDDEL